MEIYTRDSTLGGAWNSEISPEGSAIENGCHIWSFQPKAYRFIEEYLDLKLSKFLEPPKFIYKGFPINYSFVKNLEGLRNFIKFTFQVKLYWLKDVYSYFRLGQNIYQNNYLYPETGSPELIEALQQKLDQLDNVSLHFGAQIKSIEVNQENITLQLKDKTLYTDEVYITSFCSVTSIQYHDQTVKLQHQEGSFVHFLISIQKPPLKRTGYLRLVGDPFIHRLTDISYQTNFEEQLFLVGIFESEYKACDEEKIINHIRKKLKDLKLIDDSYEIKKEDVYKFRVAPLPMPQIKAIEGMTPEINYMRSTDLMYGIKRLADDHRIRSN